MKTHRQTIILLLIVTILGFCTKFYSGPGESWVNNSLGGVFYEIFWCLLFILFFQNTQPFMIALSVLAATCFLEFLQLWHPGFLEVLRSNFIGRTILGTSFSWFDFIYYFVGSVIGFIILTILNKSSRKDNFKRIKANG